MGRITILLSASTGYSFGGGHPARAWLIRRIAAQTGLRRGLKTGPWGESNGAGRSLPGRRNKANLLIEQRTPTETHRAGHCAVTSWPTNACTSASLPPLSRLISDHLGP